MYNHCLKYDPVFNVIIIVRDAIETERLKSHSIYVDHIFDKLYSKVKHQMQTENFHDIAYFYILT